MELDQVRQLVKELGHSRVRSDTVPKCRGPFFQHLAEDESAKEFLVAREVFDDFPDFAAMVEKERGGTCQAIQDSRASHQKPVQQNNKQDKIACSLASSLLQAMDGTFELQTARDQSKSVRNLLKELDNDLTMRTSMKRTGVRWSQAKVQQAQTAIVDAWNIDVLAEFLALRLCCGVVLARDAMVATSGWDDDKQCEGFALRFNKHNYWQLVGNNILVESSCGLRTADKDRLLELLNSEC